VHPFLWFLAGAATAIAAMQLETVNDSIIEETHKEIVKTAAKEFSIEHVVFELGTAVLL
jgi:hypothetical protein